MKHRIAYLLAACAASTIGGTVAAMELQINDPALDAPAIITDPGPEYADGASWIGGLTIDERPGVSYPDGVEADDRRIYLVYDYQRYRDREILMAVFTEGDVRTGSFESPAARERVLINKATGQRKE